MSKGDYNGGSTVIGPRSGWFTHKKDKTVHSPKGINAIIRRVSHLNQTIAKPKGLKKFEALEKIEFESIAIEYEIKKRISEIEILNNQLNVLRLIKDRI